MVFEELRALHGVSTPEEGVVMKVILETSQLQEDDVIAACTLAGYAGWDFVKTSTGFLGRGASLEDVRAMDAVAEYLHQRDVGLRSGHGKTTKMKVKASGGVRSYEDAVRMIEAGAMRIGTSSGMKIVQEAMAAAGEVQSKGEDKAGINEKEHDKNDY
jgi:deoxyribose-phosphate aldolase